MFSKQTVKLLRNCLKKSRIIQTTTSNYSQNVVIVGGGAMGASTAFWIKEKADICGKDVKVTVIEKDITYSTCSTSLSIGGIRQQFSLPENIQMSLCGAEFITKLKNRFGADADISYMPYGYLMLASEKGAPQMEENVKLQEKFGVKNTLLTREKLKERFAWLNVNDVELGCLGGEKEGWFDPWSLLSLLKRGAVSKGAQFINGELINFTFGNDGAPQGAQVLLSNNEQKTIPFDKCVIAAGAESGKIAKLAKIGSDDENLKVPLPVERRKRYVYRFDSQGANAPGMNTPLTIDYSGAYFRRDGKSFIGACSPKPEDEPGTSDLEVDFGFFDQYLWPLLARRVPAFESLKIKSAWGGYYEYNTFDQNGIIGPHTFYKNLYFATGFSGHGIQQSPAVGHAIAELILDGKYEKIDLSRLGFDRLITNKPMFETEIY